jgi:hypothetical protein
MQQKSSLNASLSKGVKYKNAHLSRFKQKENGCFTNGENRCIAISLVQIFFNFFNSLIVL